MCDYVSGRGARNKVILLEVERTSFGLWDGGRDRGQEVKGKYGVGSEGVVNGVCVCEESE